MNAKVLSSLSVALVITSFVPPAIAESLGEHPAVVVARTWNNRGIDPNTFIVAPPASTEWVYDASRTTDVPAHGSESPKLHWSAAIGTGYAARAIETSHNRTSSDKSNAAASPHWTSRIGSGHPFDSASPVMYTSVANTR